MNIAEQINLFLTRSAPAAFCDDCITDALDLLPRQTVQTVTSALGTTSDFDREQGVCSECGKEKKVIQLA